MVYCVTVDFMSYFMSQRKRTTKDGLNAREKEAMLLLARGVGRARVACILADRHSLSLRQAQRYTQSAALELMAEPLSTLQLDTDIALDLHRLDLLADSAMDEGDKKTAISAIKARASIANARLRSLESVQTQVRKWYD